MYKKKTYPEDIFGARDASVWCPQNKFLSPTGAFSTSPPSPRPLSGESGGLPHQGHNGKSEERKVTAESHKATDETMPVTALGIPADGDRHVAAQYKLATDLAVRTL